MHDPIHVPRNSTLASGMPSNNNNNNNNNHGVSSSSSSNTTLLNRRSSIHSASTRVNWTPPRRHSTLEIEIEYIRATTNVPTSSSLTTLAETPVQQPKKLLYGSKPQSVKAMTPPLSNHSRMNSVVEEEEEEEEEEERVVERKEEDEEQLEVDDDDDEGVEELQPEEDDMDNQEDTHLDQRLATQLSHTSPGQVYHTQQQQQQRQRQQQQPQRTPQYHLPPYYRGTTAQASRPAVVHSVQSAITHMVSLTSSHVQHESTPALSTTGSQSEDDDDDDDDQELDDALRHVDGFELLELSEGEEDDEEDREDHEVEREEDGEGEDKMKDNEQKEEEGKKPKIEKVDHHASIQRSQVVQLEYPSSEQYESPLSSSSEQQQRGQEEITEASSSLEDPAFASTTQAQETPPVIETQETLKRERTRILQRSIVSGTRLIDFKDITNIHPLKKGGYGEIHTAEWSRLKVVLKRALPDNPEGVEQFEQELEILKRTHDYDFIVPFYGVTVDPRTNSKCMVMRHCTNSNLVSFLEKNHAHLTWSERYRLSIEIAKGLEFLHKSGFHHRDLHSGNILLDDKRTALICDFGLSRSSSKTQTTDFAAAVGVASFLAPERFPYPRPVYTAACDIYSLGVIFWHISSGRIPFGQRLHEPILLRELMNGHRETIVPGTPPEYCDTIVKCWDKTPSVRPSIGVVIAVLQTLIAKPIEPVRHLHPGFFVPSETESAALPIPPELNSKMASLERASNTLNKLVFDIKDPLMKEIVTYIHDTREYFREQRNTMEPPSPVSPPTTPIYLCPLVGDLAAMSYYLTRARPGYNPINESSPQTGDTALHLACLFLESPMDTIKVLVELGADINLENLQGYTPVMILVSSNTQNCYEALKYFVRRGARIPAYIRNPITPMNSAQLYALDVVNASRGVQPRGQEGTGGAGSGLRVENGGGGSRTVRPLSQGSALTLQQQQQQLAQDQRQQASYRNSFQSLKVFQARKGGPYLQSVDQLIAQGRPLIHVVSAMQEDYRILDCLCEAGLDPAMTFAGETALVAAAAHLRIKNVEWLLNHDLDISNTESGIQRAIQVVKMLHFPTMSHAQLVAATAGGRIGTGGSRGVKGLISSRSRQSLLDVDTMQAQSIRDLGKYSWAGVTYGEADRMSRDLVGPVLHLLEQWTGARRVEARKEVATKLKLMYGSSTDPFGHGPAYMPMMVSEARTDSSGEGSLDSREYYDNADGYDGGGGGGGFGAKAQASLSFYNHQNRQFNQQVNQQVNQQFNQQQQQQQIVQPHQQPLGYPQPPLAGQRQQQPQQSTLPQQQYHQQHQQQYQQHYQQRYQQVQQQARHPLQQKHSPLQQPHHHQYPYPYPTLEQDYQRTLGRSARSLRKSQRHAIDQVLGDREYRHF
ncbi:hypothetical protein BGZ94_000789 [Podila epigama]|nr:hypothetical protein BGZ94_000789 [Podila epigama]